MKKIIKINFVGFGKSFNPYDNPIKQILDDYFDVIITDDSDYLFICTTYLNDWDHYMNDFMSSYCTNNQIRILVEGENFTPDFNLIDYAISSYPIQFYDRNFYLPCGVEAFYSTGFKNYKRLKRGKRMFTAKELNSKKYFANFICEHDSENNVRGDFYKQLSTYKRVESAGRLYRNNDAKLSWRDDSKIEFQANTKFTLCFESTKHYGFVTEKIVDAFLSNTIPIYYGSENISDIFNRKAFINCNECETREDVINRIIDIDNNDAEYCLMMQEPIFADKYYEENLLSALTEFLVNIFQQPYDKAYRRSKVYSPVYYEKFLIQAEKKFYPIVERRTKITKTKDSIFLMIRSLVPSKVLERYRKKKYGSEYDDFYRNM